MLFGLLKKREGQAAVARRNEAYQLRRKPEEKFELIQPILERYGVQSVLDVGCNAGVITRLAGRAGFFAVGIDYKVQVEGIEDPLEGACLGKIRLDAKIANQLPTFDSILLLSVYHQWIHHLGDESAESMLRALAEKTEKVLVVELSGRAMKYGYEEGQHFTDHDEESVVAHWRSYLDSVLPGFAAAYVGKSWEKKSEPFRYMFACSRQAPRHAP